VQVFEVGEHQGLPWFTMEYLPGGSLAHKLAAAPLAPRAAAALVEAVARATDHAHAQGVLHRDLKPANILLSADGQPRITDFGLAKQLQAEALAPPGQRTESGTILGTPSYMAPEQAAGAAAGPAADTYSLGAILYEALTGRPPFRAASLLETLEQVRRQEPVPPGRLQPGLPRDLQTICLKCLQKDPARRYASAGALADDLGRFLRGEPIAARPVSRPEQLWKWARRRPAAAALVGLSGVFAAVLVAGGLLYQARLREARDESQANAAAALRQQQQAAAQYRQARVALQRMLSRLQERGLAGVPRLKELQRRQLEDALAFFQEVLRNLSDPDPAVRFDAVRTYEQTATAQMLLGQSALAEENLQRACDLLAALVNEYPDRPDYQVLWATCLDQRGSACWSRSPVEGEGYYRQALELRERLAAARPDDPERQEHLALSHHHLGAGLTVLGKRAQAVPLYQRAVQIRSRLARDHPEAARYRSLLAGSHVNLGLAYQATGRAAEAERAFHEAEDLLLPLAVRSPEQLDLGLDLAALYINWSNLPLSMQQLPDMLRRLDRAVELAEGVLRQEPQYEDARSRVVGAHGQRAYVYQRLGRYAEEVRDWDRVIELIEAADRAERRMERVLALFRGGQDARAIAEATALEREPRVPDLVLYNLACVWTRAGVAARGDTRLESAQRSARGEEYAVRAVALLGRLHAAGCFKEPRLAELVRTDTDLDPLRGRADFRTLFPAATR
jgi:serine/threonine-protein kinase